MKNRSKADSTKDSLERAADTPALRRSTRSTRRPSNYSESKSPPKRKAAKETVVTVPASPPKRRAAKDAVVTVPAAMSEPRRNPKRKASIVTNRQVDLPDDLLEEALAPLTAEEIEEWAGWTELESEPAFFNFILGDLGVKDVKAQEIFSIDSESLSLLPKPVHGLIFLFQFLPSDDGPVEGDDVPDLWFANQTTSNACATVALLNIIMNCQGVDLGDKLRQFKEQTQDLDTALRGHHLSSNNYIRAIHNSFTRRMDHLNADLFLENEASAATSRRTKRRAAPKKARSKARAKKAALEYGFHFVAYVPQDGCVWELDGLKLKPRKIGDIDSDDWTGIAGRHIEARMLQDEQAQLSFNLLALCQSPLASVSQSIAHAMSSLHCFNEHIKHTAFLKDVIDTKGPLLGPHDTSLLSEFNLSTEDIDTAGPSQSLRDRLQQLSDDAQQASDLQQELVTEAKALMGEYRGELLAMAQEEQRVAGRKQDYTPALHCWVKKLAEKGVLEDIIQNSS